MARDRDTEGETVEECFQNIEGIREVEYHVGIAERALGVAISPYIINVADPDHQWFDEVGAPIQPGLASAHKILKAQLDQLARFRSVWENRLVIAKGDDDE